MPLNLDHRIFLARARAKKITPNMYTKIGNQAKKYMEIIPKLPIADAISYANGKSATHETGTLAFRPILQLETSKIGVVTKIATKRIVRKNLSIDCCARLFILSPCSPRLTILNPFLKHDH